MAIPLVVAGTVSLAALEWIWAIPAGAIAYASALLLTGEFTSEELATAGRFARGALGRGTVRP
jgi:hypothetical protein